MTEVQRRLLKVPLEVSVIRGMDELIVQGIGGYSDRTDFVREAINNLIMELRYGGTETTEHSSNVMPNKKHANGQAVEVFERPALLTLPSRVTTLPSNDANPVDAPLMGLHNRDFPTLWAAFQIAEMTTDGPIEIEDCFLQVVRRAWTFGEQLLSMESAGSQRYSALFPTNRDKATASEGNFRAFAMGRISGSGNCSGPLFQWRLCGVRKNKKRLEIGLLPEGVELLRAIDGIAPEQPHGFAHTDAFLRHLERYAREDFRVLIAVLHGVESGPTRQALVERIAGLDKRWTQEQAASYTSGYIARAREWGLVEPKMTSGTYSLTEQGRDELGRTRKDTRK